MAVAGYNTTVQVTSGSTAMVTDACTQVIAGSKYQITNAAHRRVDPNTAIHVFDNGVDKTAFATVDIFGNIVFAGYSATGPVTITGAWLPVVVVVAVKDVSVMMSGELVDATIFSSVAWKRRIQTLSQMAFELSSFANPLVDQDPGGVHEYFNTLKANGTPVILETQIPGDSNYFRAWCLVNDLGDKTAVATLQEMSVKVQSTVLQGTAYSFSPGYGV